MDSQRGIVCVRNVAQPKNPVPMIVANDPNPPPILLREYLFETIPIKATMLKAIPISANTIVVILNPLARVADAHTD